ncbi:MAG: hypothetical protein AAB658_03040 [Chloroflexota bacterium]|jgi:hypothetical protein
MTRPKSDNFVAFKCPTELRDDALALASLGGKTESDIWKEAMEFRLSFVRMVRMGYWNLRTVPIPCEVQPGLTKSTKV